MIMDSLNFQKAKKQINVEKESRKKTYKQAKNNQHRPILPQELGEQPGFQGHSEYQQGDNHMDLLWGTCCSTQSKPHIHP